MPDDTNPAAKTEAESAPGEFPFEAPTANNPRLKRRSLKPKGTALTPVDGAVSRPDLEREAPPLRAKVASKPKPIPSTTELSDDGTAGTRLYYSTQAGRKENPTPMKTTSSPAPSPTTSSIPARTSTSLRPATVSDYRSNVDRQSREQSSVGNLLSILVYSLIALFVLGASLAGYGAYIVSKQLNQQSVNLSDLDAKYRAQNDTLTAQLKATMDNISQSQAQIAREQEMILHQQEAINKLMSSNDQLSASLQTERSSRASETAALRAKIHSVEQEARTLYRP